MNLTTADKVSEQIELMRDAERQYRAPQRALLNRFFNGEPPWTEKEALDNHVLINFNDKRACNLLHQARNQCENAFSNRDNFFRIFLPDCKSDLSGDWEDSITRHINAALKGSSEWYYTQDEVWGAVVLHGLGTKFWWDPDNPIPSFVGIQDLLIPTDTHVSMGNMPCFACRRKMRPGELFKKTLGKGKNVDPAWDLEVVRKLLDDYKDINQNPNQYNWWDNPEQMAELYKQNAGGYYDSDIAPTIWMWDFNYREEGENGRDPGWYKSIILDRDCVADKRGSADNPIKFIYNSTRPIARELGHFAHFQIGDGNNVPPFMVHSIRSLAYLTYELLWTANRINCQFTQHLFEELMTFIRVLDPNDRGRLNKVVLTPPFAILPDGLQIVPASERYSPNYNVLQLGLAQYKQALGEVSSTYTQQVDTGTQKERTKFEVQAVLAQTSALLSSLLGRLYRQEHFAYVEIARRFATGDSMMAKKFRAACKADNVPDMWMDFQKWKIEADQVLGSGNRSMQVAEASELMQGRDAFDPEAQQEIKHDWVLAITNNPKKAARLAPLQQKPAVSASLHDAQQSFATLMLGVEMHPIQGMNHIDQVGGLLAAMAHVIERIEATDKMGTPQDVIGLANTAKYIQEHLAMMEKDEKMKPLVKTFSDNLGQIMNMVKGYAQRQQEMQAQAAQAQGQPQGPDPGAMAKAQSTMIQTQAKIQGKQASDAQKLQHKQVSFQQQQSQKQAQFMADQQRENVKTFAEIQRDAAKTVAKPTPEAQE